MEAVETLEFLEAFEEVEGALEAIEKEKEKNSWKDNFSIKTEFFLKKVSSEIILYLPMLFFWYFFLSL